MTTGRSHLLWEMEIVLRYTYSNCFNEDAVASSSMVPALGWILYFRVRYTKLCFRNEPIMEYSILSRENVNIWLSTTLPG